MSILDSLDETPICKVYMCREPAMWCYKRKDNSYKNSLVHYRCVVHFQRTLERTDTDYIDWRLIETEFPT